LLIDFQFSFFLLFTCAAVWRNKDVYKGYADIHGGFAVQLQGASNESGVVENCQFCFLRSLYLSKFHT